MSTITTGGSGNWSDADGTGAWTGTTKPTTGQDVVIGTGHAITLDENTASLGTISNQGNTGAITVSGTRTITGKIAYGGTLTTGFVVVGTGANLTITGPNSGAAVTGSSSGYGVFGSGSGVITIGNGTATAVSQTGSGRGVNWNSTGTLTITGDISATGGIGVYVPGNATVNITGNIVGGGAATQILYLAGANTGTLNGNIALSTAGNSTTIGLYHAGSGTFTVAGNMSIAGGFQVAAYAYASGAVIAWTGSRTLAAGVDCRLDIMSGTLSLATASAALNIANSGNLVIVKGRTDVGTLTTTAAGGTASIVNQSASATAAVIGTNAAVTITSGASIPSAANTRYGVARGWADGGTGATAGCGAAGGNGLLELPHTTAGSPTGTQDATSDACVINTGYYGSPQRQGTATAGGGSRAVIIGG